MTTAVYTGQRLHIRPTYIVSLPEYDAPTKIRSHRQRINEKNLQDNSHEGLLSRKAATKLKNAINWLVASAKYKEVYSKDLGRSFWFKVNFITLTIPPQQMGSAKEKEVKAVLHSWLSYARKYFYLKNYVWKFEAHKDGRLHIHLTSDTFINHVRLRSSWNRLLSSNGLLQAHFSKWGNLNPNSTDVHSVYKVSNLAAYLAAYMTKKPELDVSFKGRIWGCNRELSSNNACSETLCPTTVSEDMQVLFDKKVRWKAILGKADIFGVARQIGEVFFLTLDQWATLGKSRIKRIYDDHRFYIRNNILKPPKEYFVY